MLLARGCVLASQMLFFISRSAGFYQPECWVLPAGALGNFHLEDWVLSAGVVDIISRKTGCSQADCWALSFGASVTTNRNAVLPPRMRLLTGGAGTIVVHSGCGKPPVRT